MTSEIRANTLKNRVGLGTVSFTNTGIVVSGIVTANSFSGPYNGTDIVGTGITLTSTDAGSAAGPELKLFRNSASPADADYLGQLKFAGESDTGVERNYAKITGKILDASNGTEDGILEFAHIKAGSQTITGRWRSDSLQLLNGTNLSVAGDTTLTGDLDVDGHTNLDNVSIAGVTTITGDTGNVRLDLHGTASGTGSQIKLHNDHATTYFGLAGDTTGDLLVYNESNTNIKFFTNGNNERLRIASGGNVNIFKDLDVDGHTNLDNVSIAGIATVTGHLNQQYGGIASKIGYISGGAEAYYGTTSNHALFIGTAGSNRIKISNTSAATSIGGSMIFNAMLTVQGDVSGAIFQLKAAENTNRLMVAGSNTNGVEINLYDDTGGQRGILGVSGTEFFIKAPNNSAPMTFYTHNGSSIGERLRISNDGTVTIGDVDPASSSALHIRSITSAETTLELSTKGNYNGSLPSAKISFTQQNGTEIARIKCDTHTGAANMADLVFWTNYGGLYERLRIKKTGEVSISSDGTIDGLLTIKGNSDATGTPSIRLLDGSDTREVSITNSSGDFIASTHGTDNVAHGSMKIYDSGIIAFATNSGAGNAERLRVDLNGGVRHMGTAGYWQITVIHNGSGSGNWYSGSAPQRIYPNYIDNRTGYAEFYLTFHPSTSYSGYGEPTFVICGDSYFKTGGTIELNYNGRTNSPNNGVFRCYHGEYSWQIYNDGDTDQVAGQREINRNVEHRNTSYIASSSQSVDYIPTNDGRYGTNVEPIIDQRSYLKIKMNAVGSHNAIQNHDVFVKFTTYTQGDKNWFAYMQYN